MTRKIAVVDYGMGNLRSVVKALEHVAGDDAEVLLTDRPEVIGKADRVVFPGQGAARDCMRALAVTGMDEVVREAAASKPFLGICMGMQVLMTRSEENDGTTLLGLYPGAVNRFDEWIGDEHYKVPQMGWNTVRQTQTHPLFEGIPDESYFYFVHSYHVDPDDASLIAGETEYGVRFASAIARDNVFAIQCHPEKSADVGLRLLTNFIRWDG